MKKLSLLTLMASLWLALPLSANNTITTVEQVTGTVELTDDVDFHITSAEPFATTGSVNIKNVEHAVVFLDNVKPSKARTMLPFIKINGEAAENIKNCQLRIYNQGTLILPYGTAGALTVYSEKNFEGESCSEFNFNNAGGFMQTLRDNQLNNRIKSFKLKRGYMVTFAIGAEGRGYSRCFIADEADLEMASLPSILTNRISSYRLFRWQNTSKKGVADVVSPTLTNTLNCTWTYGWGAGSNLLPDAECVPHHLKDIGGPSASSMGSASYSCHMKTNNEPMNPADDPKDQTEPVDVVLANWQDLMRTGMRLLTPSSWDGSDRWDGSGYIKQFLDSIDKRGWRCDVVDAHCYWPESNFGNLPTWFRNLKRPIWISEFVWGASWNSNGAFANGVTEQQNKEAMARIWTRLNEMECVERYAYWNSERDPSRIYKNGKLTPAGEYFVAMNTGAGYVSKNEFIPRTPPVKSPSGLSVKYYAQRSECTIAWTESNPELLDSMFIEVNVNGEGWKTFQKIELNEASSSYSYKFTTEEPGNYLYRIHTFDYKGADHYSGEVYNILTSSESLGSADVQMGTVTTQSMEPAYNFFSTPLTSEPAVVFGSVSNSNSKAAIVERIRANNYSHGEYASMGSTLSPLTIGQETTFYRGTRFTDYSSFIAAVQGRGKLGTLVYEDTILPSRQVGDTVTYTFREPFSDVPVVLATPIYTTETYPLLWRVFDVTPTSCRVVLQRQAGLVNPARNPARISLFAIEKGKTTLDDGHVVIVADSTFTFTNGTLLQQDILFGDSLDAPKVLVQLQSLNRKVAGNLRTKTTSPDPTGTSVRLQLDYSDKDNNTLSIRVPAEERLGWIVIGRPFNVPEGIFSPRNVVRQLIAYPSVVSTTFGVRDDEATTASVYGSSGQCLQQVPLCEGQATIDISRLPAGIYIVRTDAHHSTKIVKK